MKRPRSGRFPFLVFGLGMREQESWSRAAVGKWETCFWFSTFPGPRSRVVGMWKSRAVCEISKGRWKEWESRLCFSTLSTDPAFPQPFPRGRVLDAHWRLIGPAAVAIRSCTSAIAVLWLPPSSAHIRYRSSSALSGPSAQSLLWVLSMSPSFSYCSASVMAWHHPAACIAAGACPAYPHSPWQIRTDDESSNRGSSARCRTSALLRRVRRQCDRSRYACE